MAKRNKNRQIDFLPPGWEWRYKGETTWTTTKGKTSDERHGVNILTGETISTKVVQNKQREERAKQGMPKSATVRRTGRIRNIKDPGKGLQTNVTKSNKEPTGVGSLFNINKRGRTETWVFYSLDDMRLWLWQNYQDGLPNWVSHAMIEVRFTERLVTTNKVGSDKYDKNGYASITNFYSPEDIISFLAIQGSTGEVENPWDLAYKNIQNYDMTGDNARVYLYLAEI